MSLKLNAIAARPSVFAKEPGFLASRIPHHVSPSPRITLIDPRAELGQLPPACIRLHFNWETDRLRGMAS